MMNPYWMPFLMIPRIPTTNDMPPTVYSLLESIVNFGKEDKTKIKNLASIGRTTFFDFDYPLSDKVDKEKFECMILNHFLMRRIGFDTLTAFKIQLDVKLNEIMPLYNKMFDVLDGWDIFNDGEKIERNLTDNKIGENKVESNNKINNSSETESDRRYSDTPQNQLDELKNGNYVTDANFDTGKDKSESIGESSSTTNTKDDTTVKETILRSPADKIAIYKEFQENLKDIYGMIFKDLECLFYQLV